MGWGRGESGTNAAMKRTKVRYPSCVDGCRWSGATHELIY